MKRLFGILTVLVLIFSMSQATAAPAYQVKLHNGVNVWVYVCKDDIFRIRMSKNAQPKESLMERYKVIKTDWAPVQSTSKDKSTFEVATNKYKLLINKKSGVLSVTDLNGKPILERILFHTGNDPMLQTMGNVINKEFNFGKKEQSIIGDNTGKVAQVDTAETGKYENNSIISIGLKPNERFYGGGSTSRKHIQHRGECLRMWCDYQRTENPQPFMLSTDGWAIYNNSILKQFFDVGKFNPNEFSIYNTNPEADFFLMFGNDMPELIGQYTLITGRPYLLPRWAYGLCFGPNMAEDQFQILNDAVKFRDMDFPCDLLWFEPQWMSRRYDFSYKKYWDITKFDIEPSWETETYPKKEYKEWLIGRIHQMGYHLGLWLCESYDQTAVEEDAIRKAEGKPQKTSFHWMDHLKTFIDQGVDGFKLDPCRTMLELPDSIYANGRTDKQVHNINQVLLPKQMQQMYEEYTGKRSWHHYCGGWAGTGHFTAATSGDNGGGSIALFDQINLGMCGFMNTSCDIDIKGCDEGASGMDGLHFGMFIPWCQINSWANFQHPFYLDKKSCEVYTDYIRLRYALFPYIYSTALEGAKTGMPIVRGMPLMFPDDRNVDDMTKEYMFGPNLLVGAYTKDIYLPGGEWIDFWNNEVLTGGKNIARSWPDNRCGLLFVRMGTILPLAKPMDFIGKKPLDSLVVKVFPKGVSSYTLNEDDGITYKYRDGATASTLFECSERFGELDFTVNATKGKYNGMPTKRVYSMEILLGKRPSKVLADGVELKDWKYTDKHIVTFDAPQPDVTKPLKIKLLQ